MKIPAGRVEAFLRRLDPAVRAVLLYGPDAGLVRERADVLVRAVAGEPTDPFRVSDVPPAALADDPARLADEAAALSLTGGRRVVRLRGAADAATDALGAVLADAPGEALIVVEAGELPPRSRLRRLFEAADKAAALPCYGDEGAALERVIRDTLTAEGVRVTPEALSYLADRLGADRMVTRGELRKLALYAGPGGRIGVEDAVACVGDASSLSLDELLLAAAEGDAATVDRTVSRLYLEGMAPVAMLRGALRHFQRLHLLARRTAAGEAPDRAVAALRPPVFFKHRDRVRAQIRLWPGDAAAAALERLNEAELACKSTGVPDRAVCHRALLELAAEAAARRGPARRRRA